MKELKLLYLYPDILDLYGDIGNIKILQYRLEKRGYKVKIDEYSINGEKPDFINYDLIFAGGGADNEQQILAKDLMKYKKDIQEAIKKGVFFLLICGAYQLFGKYYKGVDGNIIPGLEIFDYYTEASGDRSKRCIGNIIIQTDLDNTPIKIIGFENHAGQTYNINKPFGQVLCGNGNKFIDSEEGFMDNNVIATYLHGPLLSKNPELADYIIKYCLQRKYNEEIILEEINDLFEQKCRNQLINRFLENK